MNPALESDLSSTLGEDRHDGEARDRMVHLIYEELRRMAEALMRKERPGHTLQPTALVHEALFRLDVNNAFSISSSRHHLLGSAAQAMREVLVDHARRRGAEKRGGRARRVPLDAVLDHYEEMDLDLLNLHEALDRLAALHERPARVVTLRFFGGLRLAAIAEELGVSMSTVESDFRVARAWLRRQMAKDSEP